MKQHFTTSALLSSLLAAGIFTLTLPAYAQMGGAGMMGANNTMPGSGAQQMSEIQHNMSGQMMGLSEQMSRGNMSPALQKQMSERMRTMATMMGSMSGMTGKGMVMDADTQKRMDQMRMQMNTMMQGGQQMMK